ncbi:MAG TPA: DUF192 domain-containing protein [Rhodocyclaceae bacterium]|nr:DUF192 domain-containing protein [Rhodocyclaceae bacterium]
MRRDDDIKTRAVLHSRAGAHSLAIRLADGFFGRFKGLMLAAPLRRDQGLLITRCSSVHTAWMRYPIDLIYLDRTGLAVKCVPKLRPWRCSFGGAGAVHALELQAGSIERLELGPGDHLDFPAWQGAGRPACIFPKRERGSAMIEFSLVGPLITLLGMAVLQYGLLFFAKNQINHAGFMAARAGAMGHADIDSVKRAYVRALIPLYGGGKNSEELKQAFDKAAQDVSANVKFELLNPARESFDDWRDETLQETIGDGRRVIPNGGLAFRDPAEIGTQSGQSIQDANLIQIRITHGYELKVPLINTVIEFMLRWSDDGSDPFVSALYRSDRIPVVSHVTLQMQSDAVEPNDPVSMPGADRNGETQEPDETAADSRPPPTCLTIGCTVLAEPDAPVDTGPASGADPSPPGCPPGDPGCTQMCSAAMG